jgi:membrane dipeptidase
MSAIAVGLQHVDGLQSGRFDRDALLALRAGDVAAVTVTCGIWEDATEALDALARWRDLAAANADLTGIARTADDIARLNEAGRVALLLGFQNSSFLQGRIRFVELFAELGVRVVQLTYNNQNDVGGSCYEAHDGGLSRFGREVVSELNRAGVLIDLSHVGERTSRDAIEHSSAPVAITHANAASLYEHPRNKRDETLKALAARGGVIGCALYPNLVGPFYSASLDRWCELVARTIELVGAEHVAVGSDLGGEVTDADLRWMREGRWTRNVDHGAARVAGVGADDPEWFDSVEHFPALADGLARQGLDAAEVDAVMSGNWLRLYREVLR